MQMIDLVPDLRPTILAARQLRDDRNTLARYLPEKNVNAISYRLGRRQRMDQTVPIRAIDAPATPIRRPGVVDVKGNLPAITPIVDLSEQDLTDEMVMAMQLAGIPVDWTGAIMSSAAIAALTVQNTLEVMRGQVLSTLSLALTAEDGTEHEVDFGVDSGTQIVPAATAWTANTALEQFAAVVGAHADRTGVPAGVALTSRKVKQALLASLAAKYPQAPTGINTLNTYLADNDLPAIETYDRVMDVGGSRSRVYPIDRITLMPGEGQPVGRTELGITQEAVQQTQRIQPNGATTLTSELAAGLTVVTLGSDNPVRRSVKAAALGMPVLYEVDQLTVITGVFDSDSSSSSGGDSSSSSG